MFVLFSCYRFLPMVPMTSFFEIPCFAAECNVLSISTGSMTTCRNNRRFGRKEEAVSKVILNADDADNADFHRFYNVDS